MKVVYKDKTFTEQDIERMIALEPSLVDLAKAVIKVHKQNQTNKSHRRNLSLIEGMKFSMKLKGHESSITIVDGMFINVEGKSYKNPSRAIMDGWAALLGTSKSVNGWEAINDAGLTLDEVLLAK